MSQGMRLSQKLALQQVLAPQLQQSLALLQAPVMELRALVDQELARNPVLEEVAEGESPPRVELPESGAGGGDAVPEPPARETGKLDTAPEMPSTGEAAPEKSEPVDEFQAEFERLAQLDDSWREHFSQTHLPLRSREDEEERREFMLNSLVARTSLQEHLLDQVRMSDLSAEQKQVAEMIVGNLDDHGYLQASVNELAVATGFPAERIEEVLKVVQSFHPPGVAARDLRECLMLQLERAGRARSLEYRLLRDHFPALARRRLPELARAVGRPIAALQVAVERIRPLEPRPGRDFDSAEQTYVVPELAIEKVDDDYVVVMNEEFVPRLRISNTYKDLMSRGDSPREVRDYIREKIRAGKFVIKSLQQRQDTIRGIAEEIVKRQRDFLEHGITHLRPMTMAQVAEAVGVHETTVSRAVSGKFIKTPQGVFEMKSFFTSGLPTESGKDLSSKSVKDMIAQLVANEDPKKPLSDDALVEALHEKGIKIARRTVAKYRAELGILPSHLRRAY
jgi:RNA polymerase sigma-54 factor